MAEVKEEEYVHKVYNEIAHHFSETRYKPWPVVKEFLTSRETGSIGIDVGCGNGKYLNVNPNIYLLGSDRSQGLIECAHQINGKYNILIADGLQLPHRDSSFDFAISIAVVHHWSTRERRIAAIKHILSKVRPGGEILIYCWALEQEASKRGYHEGMDQDVLVPWVLQEKKKPKAKKKIKDLVKEEVEQLDIGNIDPKDRAKYIAEWKEKQKGKRKQLEELLSKDEEEKKNEVTKYRYYHLYKKGELEEDCTMAGSVVVTTGYERDNWYCIARKP
ncbi:probable tRNA (carboxymethyluridine(34)-5-O)-methyltransferase [Saccharomycodes ludwigii]|uniref:Probable tRNA (Carboxymethyluridine(34)-5-O)-methyltransferase n=1 Tax=Saccharomycodes ludwigii TaxID=36035 RepID=A0A376B3H8_9ASCO|nr:hypothetical protein SCDLUD_003322 [Saccharomycodes ludwigii]KAH3900348.1 hypothetical protein SCDLUD_003322 [Saccharomycodes ludwigii]SSD59233.1 probable tRNA (carboxymethyluridine(34)-5-O)-methyltransferase [Saccharomycodes ludwigii]